MTCADCIHEKVCRHYLGRITGGKVADPSKACADNCYMFDPAQKFGEWYVDSPFACSVCDGLSEHKYDYCPHCGARMDGVLK